jgi:hypothetical protein
MVAQKPKPACKGVRRGQRMIVSGNGRLDSAQSKTIQQICCTRERRIAKRKKKTQKRQLLNTYY